MPHGLAKAHGHVRVPKVQERLVVAQVRHQQRDDGGEQHDGCGLRGRAGELQQFVESALVPLHLLNIESVGAIVGAVRRHGDPLLPR